MLLKMVNNPFTASFSKLLQVVCWKILQCALINLLSKIIFFSNICDGLHRNLIIKRHLNSLMINCTLFKKTSVENKNLKNPAKIKHLV